AFGASSKVEEVALSKEEAKSYYQLHYMLAAQLQKHEAVVISIINLTRGQTSFKDIDDSNFREALLSSYDKLSPSGRDSIPERNDDKKSIAVAYLAKTEIQNRFYTGEKSSAKDILAWLERKFDDNEDVKAFVEDFQFRMNNYSKVEIGAIGVVVPMSGQHK